MEYARERRALLLPRLAEVAGLAKQLYEQVRPMAVPRDYAASEAPVTFSKDYKSPSMYHPQVEVQDTLFVQVEEGRQLIVASSLEAPRYLRHNPIWRAALLRTLNEGIVSVTAIDENEFTRRGVDGVATDFVTTTTTYEDREGDSRLLHQRIIREDSNHKNGYMDAELFMMGLEADIQTALARYAA